MKQLHLRVRTATGENTLHCHSHGEGSLADILRRHGLPLNTRCGQRSLCEGCAIDLLAGSVQNIHTHAPLTAGAQNLTIRACDVAPTSDLDLEIPSRALLTYAPQVESGYAIRITHARDPLVSVPGGGWGLAVDVGTTTVAVMLVDLASCEVVARASAFNAQMHLGDDVVTRITLCMSSPQGLRDLQSAILDQTLLPLIDEVLAAGEARSEDLGAIVIAGNTTMLHLLAGVDPTPMGVAPFTPPFIDHRVLSPGKLLPAWGRRFPAALVHLLPGAAAYIGADIVAGLVATGMAYRPETDLLVDVGTNGEIVLRHDGKLFACATAAGPAFEGARLASGMRAGVGAITDIVLHPDTGLHELRWISHDPSSDHTPPAGLCGSAYIDFLAEGRRTGLLSAAGRFDRTQGLPDSWHTDPSSTSLAYRVALGQGNRPLLIHECDVASLLSAKAAIHAGIAILLEHAHLTPADVKHVYLAGGFGTHMNAKNALAIGLLPAFTPEQIVPVGNSSLAGAFLALTDKSLLADMHRTAKAIEFVELNLVPTFQDIYIDSLSLP